MDTKESKYSWEDCKRFCEERSENMLESALILPENKHHWDVLHAVLVQAYDRMEELERTLFKQGLDLHSRTKYLELNKEALRTKEQQIQVQHQIIESLKEKIAYLEKQNRFSDFMGQYSLLESIELCGNALDALLKCNTGNDFSSELLFLRQVQKLFIQLSNV